MQKVRKQRRRKKLRIFFEILSNNKQSCAQKPSELRLTLASLNSTKRRKTPLKSVDIESVALTAARPPALTTSYFTAASTVWKCNIFRPNRVKKPCVTSQRNLAAKYLQNSWEWEFKTVGKRPPGCAEVRMAKSKKQWVDRASKQLQASQPEIFKWNKLDF